ncbi:MAG: YabP/YqfC family sporulation protein [Clostridia bacterium]|nr:YabP/YqfC family sporulation protein [Clostridia bacterium]
MKRFSKLSRLFMAEEPVYIEIKGKETVLAEGYCRIDTYSDSVIVLGSENARFAVRGKGLMLKHLSFGKIAVEGEISGVEII